MNSSPCIQQYINHQELAQKQLENQTKKKEKNQRYYQNKKQELENLDKIKVQLGIKQSDVQGRQNSITVRDHMIILLQLKSKIKKKVTRYKKEVEKRNIKV